MGATVRHHELEGTCHGLQETSFPQPVRSYSILSVLKDPRKFPAFLPVLCLGWGSSHSGRLFWEVLAVALSWVGSRWSHSWACLAFEGSYHLQRAPRRRDE